MRIIDGAPYKKAFAFLKIGRRIFAIYMTLTKSSNDYINFQSEGMLIITLHSFNKCY